MRITDARCTCPICKWSGAVGQCAVFEDNDLCCPICSGIINAMVDRGVVYIAYGDKARREARRSIKGMRKFIEYITVIDESVFEDSSYGARWAKLNIDTLSPYRFTLYLDADTRVNEDINRGFNILADGWDMCIAPSGRQGNDCLGHIPVDDRRQTLEHLNMTPLNLQAGMFFFNRDTTKELFELWRIEWDRGRQFDQGAFLRALYYCPRKIWILGSPWNSLGGEIIDHQFGRAV